MRECTRRVQTRTGAGRQWRGWVAKKKPALVKDFLPRHSPPRLATPPWLTLSPAPGTVFIPFCRETICGALFEGCLVSCRVAAPRPTPIKPSYSIMGSFFNCVMIITPVLTQFPLNGARATGGIGKKTIRHGTPIIPATVTFSRLLLGTKRSFISAVVRLTISYRMQPLKSRTNSVLPR